MTWQAIETCPESAVVMTKIDDAQGERNVQTLKKQGNLFWTPDGAMYVYYRPTHWKPDAPADGA